MILAPSILTVKEEERDKTLKKFLSDGIKFLHLDIMDGKFVPNTTLKSELLEKVNSYNFTFDSHLMVTDPENYLDDFAKYKTNIFTFHYEAVTDVKSLIDKVHSKNLLCGVSIKPKTDPTVLLPYLEDLDVILVMSVEPGFGGQKFMPEALTKIEYLSKLKNKNNYHYLIEADGGINKDNASLLAKSGCDIVVMGTAYLKEDNKKDLVKYISSL